jgi:hypothetical protein
MGFGALLFNSHLQHKFWYLEFAPDSSLGVLYMIVEVGKQYGIFTSAYSTPLVRQSKQKSEDDRDIAGLLSLGGCSEASCISDQE